MSKASKLILEYPNFSLSLFLSSGQIFSSVSSPQSSFTSQVFGMTSKDLSNILQVPPSWCKRLFKVNISSQSISFCRGLQGGGSGALRRQIRTERESSENIKKSLEVIKKKMNERQYNNLNELENLIKNDPFNHESPIQVFNSLFDEFFKDDFFKQPNLWKERKKLSFIMRNYLHKASHPSYLTANVEFVEGSNEINKVREAIEYLKPLNRVTEQATLVELEIILALMQSSGRSWWQKLYKTAPTYFNHLVNKPGVNKEKLKIEIIRFSQEYFRELGDNFKDFASFLDYFIDKESLGIRITEVFELFKIQNFNCIQFAIFCRFFERCIVVRLLSEDLVKKVFDGLYQVYREKNNVKLLQLFAMLQSLNDIGEENLKRFTVKFYEDSRHLSPIFKVYLDLIFIRNETTTENNLISPKFCNIKKNLQKLEFVGRDKELREITEVFEKVYRSEVNSPVILINSTEPAGKTALAYRYLAINAAKYKYLFFINSTSAETIRSDIFQIAYKIFDKTSIEKSYSNQLMHFLSNLPNEEKALIIFDNLSDINNFTNHFAFSNKVHYIITTRSISAPPTHQYHLINLTNLRSEDSELLFRTNLKFLSYSQEDIKEAGNNLQNNPSSIIIASKLILNTNTDIKSITCLSDTLHLFKSSIESKPELIYMIEILSCFEPTKVPIIIIKEVFKARYQDENKWTNVKSELLNRGIIEDDSDLWEVNNVITSQYYNNVLIDLVAMKIVTRVVIDRLDFMNNWELAYFCIHHVNRLVSLHDIQKSTKFLLEAYLASFQIFVEKRRDVKIDRFVQEYEVDIDKEKVETQVEILKISLAISIEAYKVKSAANIAEKLFALSTLNFDVYGYLAGVQAWSLNFNRANEIFSLFTKNCLKKPETDESYALGYADFLMYKENYAEAEKWYGYYFELVKNKNDLVVGNVNLKLAKCYFGQKKFQQCYDLLSKRVIRANAFDEIHPDLIELNLLKSQYYLQIKDLRQSLYSISYSLNLQNQIIPANHFSFSKTYLLYGKNYLIRKEIASSKSNLDKSLQIKKLYENETKEGLAEVYYLYAVIDYKNKNFDSSLKNLSTCISYRNNYLYHPKLSDIEYFRGKCKFQLDNYQEALDHFKESIKYRNRRKRGPSFKEVNCLIGQMKCYKKLKNLNEIKSLSTILQNFITSNPNVNQIKFHNMYLEIGYSEFSLNNYDSAENWYKNCLQQRQTINKSEKLAEIYLRLGELNLSKNDLESSIKYLEDSLKIKKPLENYYDSILNDTHYFLGKAYYSFGLKDKAKAHLSTCLYNRSKKLARDHEDIFKVKYELAVYHADAYFSDKIKNCDDCGKSIEFFNFCFDNIPKNKDLKEFEIKIKKYLADLNFDKEETLIALTHYLDFEGLVISRTREFIDELFCTYERLNELYCIFAMAEENDVQKEEYKKKQVEYFGKWFELVNQSSQKPGNFEDVMQKMIDFYENEGYSEKASDLTLRMQAMIGS